MNGIRVLIFVELHEWQFILFVIIECGCLICYFRVIRSLLHLGEIRGSVSFDAGSLADSGKRCIFAAIEGIDSSTVDALTININPTTITMKKCLVLVLAALLLAFTASAQMKRGSEKKKAPKTEKTTSKKTKTKGKPSFSKSSGMTQSQKEHIIQQAIDDMVWVEGGTFTMGSNDGEINEKPTHQVTLSGFYISKYEVTQELWQAVMDANPSEFKGDSRRPVENVSWYDCQEFINKLNHKTGKAFRLPTEAEWEFAARGGNQSCGYYYSGSNDRDAVAWYRGENSHLNSTYCVGKKSPNELGLYDMSGNVYEWCQDWYGSYSSEPQTNPSGPSSGTRRVLRGGCWNVNWWLQTVSFRDRPAEPDSEGPMYGLRLAL